MKNKWNAFLTCLCIALAIALGVTRHQLMEAREQNARMEQQMREIRSQVDGIWSEYVSTIKRIQQHRGRVAGVGIRKSSGQTYQNKSNQRGSSISEMVLRAYEMR